MSSLLIRRLTRADADAAFALARLDAPSLTPEDWRVFVATDPALGGVLRAQAGTAVRGILRYTILTTDDGRRLFNIERLAAFDMFNPAPVAHALVAQAEGWARSDYDCSGISLSTGFDDAHREAIMRAITGVASLHRIF